MKVNSKCPAIIFAAKQILNVPGRIMFLINSIITINGIKILGVPWGTWWASMWFVLNVHPIIINLIHIGNDKDKFIDMCLLDVKTNEKSPIKLIIIIIENNEIKLSS